MRSLVVAWGARRERAALGAVLLLALAGCGGTPSGTAQLRSDASASADSSDGAGDAAAAPSCAPPDAGAPVRLFHDDFSETPAGQPPSASLWTVTATAPATATVGRGDAAAPFVALSSPSTCTSGCVAQISPRLSAPASGSSLWTRATVTLGALPTDYAYAVQLLDATGTLYVELLIQVHAATPQLCDVVVAHATRDGTPEQELVASNLVIGATSTWTFGAEIDDPTTGHGVFSVYRDGQPIALRVPTRPYNALGAGETYAIVQPAFWDLNTTTDLANVEVWSADPESLAPVVVAGTAPPPPPPFTVAVDPSNGGTSVTVAGTPYVVRSTFAPTGTTSQYGLGATPLTWTPTVLHSGSNYTVTATAPSFSLSRQITVSSTKVRVDDTLTSTSASLVGLVISNEVDVAWEWYASTIGGFYHAPAQLNAPERAFIHVVSGNTALGFIPYDDVYRNHAILYGALTASGAAYTIQDANLGLAPLASVTLSWELYPLGSADYFDFINTVRAARGTSNPVDDFLTVFNGSLPGVDLADAGATAAWIAKTRARVFLDTVVDDGAPTIIAHGGDYLTKATANRAAQTNAAALLRAADPSVRVLPYMDYGLNPAAQTAEDATFDSQVVIDGVAQTFSYPGPDGGTYLENYYFGTATNAFAQLMGTVEQTEYGDFGQVGMYFDEFSSGYVSGYSSDPNYWDQVSVAIDTTTTPSQVTGKLVNVALMEAPMRDAFIRQLLSDHKVVWGNEEPTTIQDTQFGFPSFLEFPELASAARGHLASPIGYVGYGIDTLPALMNNVASFLQMGLIPGFYADPSVVTATVVGDIFPITPVSLGAGTVVATDRIVTARSGTFGFGDTSSLAVSVYDRTGALRCTTRGVKNGGTTSANVTLGPSEVAIVRR